jgi:hypothetical protein
MQNAAIASWHAAIRTWSLHRLDDAAIERLHRPGVQRVDAGERRDLAVGDLQRCFQDEPGG